uniref:Rab3 GTPase-activating protein catalytic subunit n=1 Tax=Heligmosomoides polygyrus TaxID=6339 RepID=A0A183GL96_HELPZ
LREGRGEQALAHGSPGRQAIEAVGLGVRKETRLLLLELREERKMFAFMERWTELVVASRLDCDSRNEFVRKLADTIVTGKMEAMRRQEASLVTFESSGRDIRSSLRSYKSSDNKRRKAMGLLKSATGSHQKAESASLDARSQRSSGLEELWSPLRRPPADKRTINVSKVERELDVLDKMHYLYVLFRCCGIPGTARAGEFIPQLTDRAYSHCVKCVLEAARVIAIWQGCGIRTDKLRWILDTSQRRITPKRFALGYAF